jgi:hypothetical protein
MSRFANEMRVYAELVRLIFWKILHDTVLKNHEVGVLSLDQRVVRQHFKCAWDFSYSKVFRWYSFQ